MLNVKIFSAGRYLVCPAFALHPQNYDRNTKDTFPCCGAAEKVPLYKKDISLGFLNIPIFLLFSKNFGCIYLNHSGERSVRIREVESSSLFRSTIKGLLF